MRALVVTIVYLLDSRRWSKDFACYGIGGAILFYWVAKIVYGLGFHQAGTYSLTIAAFALMVMVASLPVIFGWASWDLLVDYIRERHNRRHEVDA